MNRQSSSNRGDKFHDQKTPAEKREDMLRQKKESADALAPLFARFPFGFRVHFKYTPTANELNRALNRIQSCCAVQQACVRHKFGTSEVEIYSDVFAVYPEWPNLFFLFAKQLDFNSAKLAFGR